MITSLEVLCIKIMTPPQVFGQKFTPIRRFLGLENSPILGTHPYCDPIWECPPPPGVPVSGSLFHTAQFLDLFWNGPLDFFSIRVNATPLRTTFQAGRERNGTISYPCEQASILPIFLCGSEVLLFHLTQT